MTTATIIHEPFERYLAAPGLSYSGLKALKRNPAYFKFIKDNPSEESASQRLGSTVHAAILEPERFEADFIAIEGHRGRADVKAAIEKAEIEGKAVCKPSEMEIALRLRDAVYKKQSVSKLLTGGRAEQTIKWTHPEFGIQMKCRPDYFRPDGLVIDLKTYSDLSEENIQRQIIRMKYHWQSQHYLSGVNAALNLKSTFFGHIFLDIECFQARAVILDDASLDKAQTEMEPLLAMFAACMKTQLWPDYPDEILTTALPHWAWREE